jgi:hypothetical protein
MIRRERESGSIHRRAATALVEATVPPGSAAASVPSAGSLIAGARYHLLGVSTLRRKVRSLVEDRPRPCQVRTGMRTYLPPWASPFALEVTHS